MKRAALIALGVVVSTSFLAAPSANSWTWQRIGETGDGPLKYSIGTTGRTTLSLPTPNGGVVTSVSVRTSGAAATGQVVLVRPVANGAGFMQFASDPVPISVPASADPNGVITEVATSWQAQKGDTLALKLSDDMSSSTLSTYESYGDNCASFSEAPKLGLQFASSPLTCGQLTPAISGGLESDYDGDGFPDRADRCFADPTRHNAPCDSFELSVVQAPPKKVRKGKTVSFKLRLTNNGPATESSGIIQLSLQHGSQKHFKILPGPLNCSATFPFENRSSCKYVGFGAGESHEVQFKLRATGTGKATITAVFERTDFFNTGALGTSIQLPVKVLTLPKRKHSHKH
jgi:hypothetical protein